MIIRTGYYLSSGTSIVRTCANRSTDLMQVGYAVEPDKPTVEGKVHRPRRIDTSRLDRTIVAITDIRPTDEPVTISTKVDRR